MVCISLCFLRSLQSIGKYSLSKYCLPDAVLQVGNTAANEAFNKHALNTYCVPGTILGSRDKAVSKIELLVLLELMLQ